MTTNRDPKVVHFLGPPSALVARTVGIVCIALGFVVGMEGLSDPNSMWLRTALGLIVTGLLAQVYALLCRVRQVRRPQGEGKGRARGGDRPDEELKS